MPTSRSSPPSEFLCGSKDCKNTFGRSKCDRPSTKARPKRELFLHNIKSGGIEISIDINSGSVASELIQRIPGLWSSVGTRQCPVPTGIYRSGMYFINVESAVLPEIRTRQCRVPTRFIVGTRHCRVLAYHVARATGIDLNSTLDQRFKTFLFPNAT